MNNSKQTPQPEETGKPLRILYIDDELLVRESLAKYLERCGYEVMQAETGEKGVEIFQLQRPDAVLVDLRMPGMGGLEVLERVNRESPETPVVLISGAGMLQDAIEALRLGAWDFITKPIQDLALLDYTLKKVWERASLIRENREYTEDGGPEKECRESRAHDRGNDRRFRSDGRAERSLHSGSPETRCQTGLPHRWQTGNGRGGM